MSATELSVNNFVAILCRDFASFVYPIDGAISCTKILSFVDCICHLSGKLVVLYSLGAFI